MDDIIYLKEHTLPDNQEHAQRVKYYTAYYLLHNDKLYNRCRHAPKLSQSMFY